MNEITLSNGVTITHKVLGNDAIEALVKGSDREMSCAEWAEYLRRQMCRRAAD